MLLPDWRATASSKSARPPHAAWSRGTASCFSTSASSPSSFVASLVARLRDATRARTSSSCSAAPFTWTVKLADATLPAASDVLHVTKVSPMANVSPDANVHVGFSLPLTTSVAVAVNSAVVLSGTALSAGGVVSTTVIVNVFETRLPYESDVEHVTFVVPSGNSDPEAGLHVTASATPL